jgi:hypothetical protein
VSGLRAEPPGEDEDGARSFLRRFGGARAPQAVAGEIDAVGVVHDAIEDGVGVGRIADQIVPFVDGDLAGDDR